MQLASLDRQRSEIAAQLIGLELELQEQLTSQPHLSADHVSMASPSSEKISLFRSLFRGREDVFPHRWQNVKTGKAGYAPACQNEWVPGICSKPKVKCGECSNQAFTAVSDDVVRSHLADIGSANRKDFTLGVYPLLRDESCWFIAADFDKASWMLDVAAFRDTARAKGVFVAIERSRSGNGAHAWIFFSEPVRASDARRLGSVLLTATMDSYPDIGFDSYDRFFPTQDTMPVGGFGNLIALPLQKRPRTDGNSVFVDDNFCPFDDQWKYLSSVKRLSRSEVMSVVGEAVAEGQVLGVGLPLSNEDEEPWATPPSRHIKAPPIPEGLPKSLAVVLGNQYLLTAQSSQRHLSVA